VLVPGALGLLLLIFPWLDCNPQRRAKKRIPEIALALVSIAVLFVLSYMGTARYGITFQPAVQVEQAFAPEEQPGLLQQVAFDDLPVGVYEIGMENGDPLPPTFAHLLKQLDAALKTAFTASSASPQAWLMIEERQARLKQITLRIQWRDSAGEIKFHERVVYIHRDGLEQQP